MAVDGSALLREAGHVQYGAAFPFEMGRHTEQRPDRHDASPANPSDQDSVRLVKRGTSGARKRREPILAEIADPALFEPAALHGHKARAESFHARIILVAARLIDRALAAELGLDRHHRKAVRSLRAIAAALADKVIDKNPFGR